MKILLLLVPVIILGLIFLWAFMTAPKTKLPEGAEEMKKFLYAHRGLHSKEMKIPENSLAAFRRAADAGYAIELDVHLTRDSRSAVIHDSSLKRTTGADVRIWRLTSTELKGYRLENTSETIPLLGEVLEVIQGKVPLLIELKVDKDNFVRLSDRVVKDLRNYKGVYALQSFDPRVLKHLKTRYPHIIRGQLSGNLKKSGSKVHPVMDFGLRNLLTNFLARPHFIAYRLKDSSNAAMTMCRALFRPMEFNWTIRTRSEHERAKRNGAIAIFEHYIPKI